MKIVATYKFKGNIFERNQARKDAIKELANGEEIKDIIHRAGAAYKSHNYDGLKEILLNELFFEEREEVILNKYINKLYENKINIDMNESIDIYRKYARKGLLHTIDKVVRG